jgi:hypothetical protein
MAVRCLPPSCEPTSSDHGDEVADASCYGVGLYAKPMPIDCSCSLADVCLGRVSLLFTHVDTWQAYLQHAPRGVVACVPLCLPAFLLQAASETCLQAATGRQCEPRPHMLCARDRLKASLLSLTMHLS